MVHYEWWEVKLFYNSIFILQMKISGANWNDLLKGHRDFAVFHEKVWLLI